jgi:Zn-dependent protease
MSEDGAGVSSAAGPWGPRDGSEPPAAAIDVATAMQVEAPEARPANNAILLNLVSTALLAGWLAYTSGWRWALGAVVGVFVHEYGHVIAINLLGCGPGRIRIVPFLGGAAYPRIPPPTEFKGVVIALAGPVFGLLATFPFFAAAYATGDVHWLDAAFVIAVINLLNLMPAPPLDGSKAIGPALARVHPWVERAVVLLVGGVAVAWAGWAHQYILAFFLGLGVLSVLRAGVTRPFALKLTPGEFACSIVLYAAALGLCVAALWAVSGFSDQPLRALIEFLTGRR